MSTRHARPLTELAQRLRRVAREEAASSGSVDRWTVLSAVPFVIEEIDGPLVLEDGDPDFVIGDLLRQHILRYGVTKGDQIIVVHSGGEWHALDAASGAELHAGALAAGSYTMTGGAATRTLDVSTATLPQVANVLATLIRDLGGT